MDEKTLEYMGKRVDLGRKYLEDIATLKRKLEVLQDEGSSGLRGVRFEFLRNVDFSTRNERVLGNLQASAIEVVENEITYLERQFQEL